MIVMAGDAEAQALAATIAVERSRHIDPESIDGRRRSRAAIRRWCRKIPAGLDVPGDVPLLIARHRDYWLGSAAGLVRSLDPAGLGAGAFHVVDLCDVGIVSETLLGIHAPYTFWIFRSRLPRSAVPGPCVAVNLAALVAHAAHHHELTPGIDEAGLREAIRLEVCAVALHEAAHAIDCDPMPQATELADIPPSELFPIVARQWTRPIDRERRIAGHGPRWMRALAHLAHRATKIPPADWWVTNWLHDVATIIERPADDALDAITNELLTADPAEPIAAIVRREPPAPFIAQVQTR